MSWAPSTFADSLSNKTADILYAHSCLQVVTLAVIGYRLLLWEKHGCRHPQHTLAACR